MSQFCRWKFPAIGEIQIVANNKKSFNFRLDRDFYLFLFDNNIEGREEKKLESVNYLDHWKKFLKIFWKSIFPSEKMFLVTQRKDWKPWNNRKGEGGTGRILGYRTTGSEFFSMQVLLSLSLFLPLSSLLGASPSWMRSVERERKVSIDLTRRNPQTQLRYDFFGRIVFKNWKRAEKITWITKTTRNSAAKFLFHFSSSSVEKIKKNDSKNSLNKNSRKKKLTRMKKTQET